MQLILRISALILLYLLVTNFAFFLKKTTAQSPPILLVDCSPSMRNHLKEVLALIDSLNFRYQKLFFSDSVYTDTAGINARFTNITKALQISDAMSPVAIIMVSDGNHNYGSPPEDVLKNFTTPIYCFGAGNKNIKEQRIADIFCPDYAFYNDTTTIEVVIEICGYNEKIGNVKLEYDGLKFEKEIRLSENMTRKSLKFKFVPSKPGMQRYKISLTPMIDEVDYSNNEYTGFITVFERKLSVLYYTDYPSFNSRFIIESLTKNPDIELSEFVRISKDKYHIKGKINNQAKIDFNQFDIIVFDNIESKSAGTELKNFLNKNKGILVTGNIIGQNPFLNEILPFQVSGTQFEQELPVSILSPFSILSPAENYAPVSKINHVLKTNENITLIARAGNFPLIGYRLVENGVVFQINISEFGLWHFIQMMVDTRNVMDPLLGEILRLLSPYGRNQRLVLRTAKNTYNRGEQVRFNLTAYSRNFLPCPGGEFYLLFNNKKIPFFEVRPGFYEASFLADEPGNYNILAMGTLLDDTLKSNQINLNVVQTNIEPTGLINEQMLIEISRKTGGDYYELSHLKNFKLPENREKYEIVKFSFDKPFVYFLIFSLITLDWVIRKKGGMI